MTATAPDTVTDLTTDAVSEPVVPSFLADVDAEDRAELAALAGVELPAAAPDDQVALKLLASRLLKAMCELRHEGDELEALWNREADQVDAIYRPQTEKLERRYQALERAVAHLGTLADFGSKKSATVAFGQFGRRSKSATLKVVDAQALLGWAEVYAPNDVAVKVERSLPHKVALAHFTSTGEIPDGCEHVPARDEGFAKPVERLGGDA